MRLAPILYILLALPALPVGGRHGPDPFAVMAEFDRIATSSLWPGFEPQRVSVALYDGERTLLFRHPSPPEGFVHVEGRDDVHAFAGLHPAVRANTSAELGGVLTATYMLAADDPRPPRAIAAAVVHEAFHVFQQARHPEWEANEVELFTYPVDDAALLELRRLETQALQRSLSARERPAAACWAAAALRFRRDRYARMPEGSAAYERGVELKEGLAQYVESRAAGEAPGPVLPSEEFPAQEIRERAYAVGRGLANLLDGFDPHWKGSLEAGSTGSLDELLAERLAGFTARAPAPSAGAEPASSAAADRAPSAAAAANPLPLAGADSVCEFSAGEREATRARARADVEALRARRSKLRSDFMGQAGWRVVVLASANEPLMPQGFDPLNVDALGGAEVLHGRWLKLGNSAGSMEALDRRVLTEGTEAHPLFAGVRQVTVAGLAAEPIVRESDAGATLSAEGLTAEFRGATVERSGRTVTLRL